jgi:hypothetical protein
MNAVAPNRQSALFGSPCFRFTTVGSTSRRRWDASRESNMDQTFQLSINAPGRPHTQLKRPLSLVPQHLNDFVNNNNNHLRCSLDRSER